MFCWKKLSIAVMIGFLGAFLGMGKVTLTFMTPLGGADGAYMDQIVARFNEEFQGKIEVVHLVVVDSIEYKMKLATGIATATAPQVLFMRKFDTPAFLEHFRTWTAEELRDEWGIDINDIYPSLIEGLIEDGKVYGIPLDCWIFYMAYNRDNFRKVGLDPDRPPTNKEEFYAAMEALKAITPEGVTPYYESPTWPWIWVHFLWQFGGDLLTPDFREPAFQEAGAAALRLMMEMQELGYLPKVPVDPGPPFHAGEASVLITGIWTMGPWKETLGEAFGIAPVPQLGPVKAVFGGSHVLALPAIMVKDPEVYNAAMTWINYLWDHALDWYAAGQTPARISIATSAELKEKLPEIYTVAQQLPYVKTFQMFPYISEVLAEIAVYNEKVLITRELTPEEAMRQAAEAVKEILEEYWLEYGG